MFTRHSRHPLMSLALSSLAVVTFAGAAHAQFEGTVTMRMNTARGPNDMAWSIKGDRARMDMNTGRGTMYMIRQGDKNTIVMPDQHMYMEQTINPATLNPRGDVRGKTADIQFTGRKETIAGYECEHVLVTGEQDQYDVCLAKGLGTFMMPNNPMGRGRGNDDSPMSSALKKLGGAVFPLKVQKVGGGVDLEVTKIEKKSLDDSMFSVPSDYRKLDIGAMMGRPPAHE